MKLTTANVSPASSTRPSDDTSMERARRSAFKLGAYLSSYVHQAQELFNEAKEGGLAYARGVAFEAVFGRRAETTVDPTNGALIIDQDVRIEDGDAVINGTMVTSHPGDSARAITSLTSHPAFFYVNAVLARDGRLYQGGAQGDFYGPLAVPEEARIDGEFTDHQWMELQLYVQSGIATRGARLPSQIG
jgi:hypothetical protein